ncbi:MAG: GerAB/ArcD/ProY family transporter [Candidatus Coproplasma sp.]
MINAISVRQICIIMLCYSAVSKLMLFPTTSVVACGNSLWFPALLNLTLQTVTVWAVSYLSSRTDKTFYELLKGTFGEVAARIIFGLFALFFILNALIPMTEQRLLVHEVFYDTIPALIVFLPFFFFSVYAGSKKFTNLGRTADMCLPIFVVTLAGLVAMSLPECDFTSLLPVLKQPASKLFGGALAAVFRFTDSAFLLMFMGHYKYKKGDSAKITLSYAAGGLIVIFFMLLFYAVYGELAPLESFAITKTGIFFSAINLIGRADIIAVYALDIVALFAIVLNVQLSCYCLQKAFKRDNRPLYSLAVNSVLLALTLIFNNSFHALEQVGARWLWIPAVIFAYVIPLSAWALRRKQ